MTMPALAAAAFQSNPGTVSAERLTRIATLTQPLKARIRALLELRPGLDVLDVGCGPGLDAVAVAARVGPSGRAVGLDYDPRQLAAARRHARGVSPAPVFTAGDATSLPYGNATFDRAYSERVLQHCVAAERVVSEMVRVTRPGGLVVVADADWATLSIDTPAVGVERSLVRFVGDALRNGYAGRQLRRLLLAARLCDVDVEVWPIVWTDYELFCATSLPVLRLQSRAVSAGAITECELQQFEAALAAAGRSGTFFASAALMIARGRRPPAGPGRPPSWLTGPDRR